MRRQFEGADLAELLRERGIDYSDPIFESDSALPLDPFDDSEYDVRTPHEWLDLGYDQKTSEFKPLAAQALFYESGVGVWRRALVSDYDGKQFEVRWDEPDIEGRPAVMLPRLRIHFVADDPVVFADRCKAAHEARRYAESMVKYNFYIDNMPTDDVQTLNSDQTERLIESIQKPRPSEGDDQEVVDAEAVLQEIKLDFARTMNRIMFDVHLLERPDDDPMHKGLRAVAEMSPVAYAVLHNVSGAAQPVAPQEALVPIPHHHFAETFASFCLATLRVRPEVVLALHGIRETCNRLIKEETVLCSNYKKPLRIEEFRQMQRMALSAATFQLKEVWRGALHQIVMKEFAFVGKGWFNINETSQDLYKRGKLIRFLGLLRLIMQDTLRQISENAMGSYVEAIDRLIPLTTQVKSLNEAVCVYQSQSSDIILESGLQSMPLFSIEAMRLDAPDGDISKSALALSTEPQRFVAAALEAFDSALAMLNEIQPLERLVVPNLNRNQTHQVLSGVDIKDPSVVKIRGHLEARLISACPAITDFMRLLRRHEELLRLDPGTHVANITTDCDQIPDDAQVQEMIEWRSGQEMELMYIIPESPQVGLFQIGCKDLRRHLLQKHSQVISILKDVLLERMRNQMNTTMDSFQSMAVLLRKVPSSIEELIEMRHFAEGVPKQVALLREQIARDIKLFDRLEDLRFYVPLEDVRQRWKLAAAPRNAIDLVANALRLLQKNEEQFTKQLLSQQKDFSSTLCDLDSIVELFRHNRDYRDVRQYLNIKDVIENCNERLAAAAQEAKQFNSREVLLGKPKTDYSRLEDTARNFEPFSALWLTVATWLTHKDAWHTGPLQNIDVAFMEREVCRWASQLSRVMRRMRDDAEHEEILEVASQAHREIEEFRPHVQLIVALRTEGMRPCDWEEITKIVGIDQAVGPEMLNFTLATVLGEPFHLQDHCAAIEEVAGRAAKARCCSGDNVPEK
jgi:dynein heavy chain